MIKTLKFAVLATGIVTASHGLAADLTVVSFGGANKEAQVKAFYKPWQQASGSKIISGEYNGEMAKVKAMVDTRSVSWDAVEVESAELARGCDEGMFETLDPAQIGLDSKNFVPGAIQPCGIGFLVYSTVLAYNASKLKEAPTGWKDFWDVERFPGKRGLRKLAKSTLEFALIADGVEPGEVYSLLATEAGQDRAFAKLDQIKPHIQWWEAGAQPPQYLAAGDVVMSSVYNGRLSAEQRKTYDLKIVWSGGLYEFDSWAIPRGASRQEKTREFIAFSLEPQQQKSFAEHIDYGAANLQAMDLLDKARIAELPTAPENLAQQVAVDALFWADHGEHLEQRFNAWASR
ncbi:MULTISPECIES: ABC transporter substrate-binding protein [Pseudomonas]|uniref:ABC transporter substrate-binding protein n=1 Tax=Pseudomonas auratipiscis TaxID=3115853 RepID=A0AB35WXJ2_9PSED|nr:MULTISPECIES: ABC transporter substrate-binding protein [unclassified Pseudomonas]MEE1866779.1 ABC transporter substrate-binding protein [Pseudomonas sp. 120P]MEE1958675.1 ABC transporter substrate-binding protein [Pseudomonas sp. 119P]